MTTYRVVPAKGSSWAIEWSASGVVLGSIRGRFDNKIDALITTFELSRGELLSTLKFIRAIDMLGPRPNGRDP